MSRPILEFEGMDKPEKSIIKVIGVGGGGGNAVDNMYKQGIHDVNFLLCNTDSQVLAGSDIPTKIQLGPGLGAGGDPKIGREYAEKDADKIREQLNDGTKMVFITAGMGGGTGTGAAPVVARIAKDMGILTVGIVTIPFLFEGEEKIYLALEGVKEIKKNVDALLVVNNERILDIYEDETLDKAFANADNILTTAAKSIAEIITLRGIINVDFEDVKSALKDGGVAIMSSGFGEGDQRIPDAIKNALNSPLLSNNTIFDSQRILINITTPVSEEFKLRASEMKSVTDFMKKFSKRYKGKFGVAVDPSLEKKVKVTILATGFGMDAIEGMPEHEGHIATIDQAKKEEENRMRQELISEFYGDSEHKKPIHTHTFTAEDIDNDTIIEKISTSPTFARTSSQLEGIVNSSRKFETAEEMTSAEANTTDTISFDIEED